MITYRAGNDLDLDQVIELYRASRLGERRPVGERDRMAAMLKNANLVITAWDGDLMVGISRALTDFSYITYLSDLAVDRSIIFTAVATVGAIMLALSYLVFKSQKLTPTMGMDGLIGATGDVRGKLALAGKVFVHGEYWNAEADTEIDVGEKVEVIGYQGMRLKVRRSSKS